MSTANLEITDKDIEFPAGDGRERSAGLGNGSPVEPSSASTTILRHSATFGELCKALAAASLEFAEIEKGTENPYFGSWYADLAALIKATRGPLAKHGLVVLQFPQAANKGVRLTTMLMHSTGEWIASDLELPAKVAKPKKKKANSEYDEDIAPEPVSQELRPDAQALGSAITYARRYSYQAILNIAGEEDDDGNAAVGRTQRDWQSSSTEAGPGKINPVQMRAIQSACTQGGKTPKQLTDHLGSLGFESLEELPKAKQGDVIKWALGK